MFCSIYQDYKLYTVKTDCNHHFCQECIEKSLKQYKVCPLCKNEIKNIYEYNIIKLFPYEN